MREHVAHGALRIHIAHVGKPLIVHHLLLPGLPLLVHRPLGQPAPLPLHLHIHTLRKSQGHSDFDRLLTTPRSAQEKVDRDTGFCDPVMLGL